MTVGAGPAAALAPYLRRPVLSCLHAPCRTVLPAGGVVEYKYVLLDHGGNHAIAWQVSRSIRNRQPAARARGVRCCLPFC